MTSLNPNHPMSQFGADNAIKFIACIIWKLRRHCPNLAVEITAEDMRQLAEVFMANGQTGIVSVTGKRDCVVPQLVDQQTGQMLVADKKLDENSHNARMMARCMDARKRAPGIADRLLKFRNADDPELRKEAAEALRLLTWEPEQ